MPKRRRILKRTGGVMSVVILGAWVASTFWAVDWVGATRAVGIESGTFFSMKFRDEAALAEWQVRLSAKESGWSIRRTSRWDVIGFDTTELTSYFGLRLPQIRPLYSRADLSPNAFGTLVDIPFWTLFFIVALPTGFMFWRDRRRYPRDHCQACGYNLTGADHACCPECGAECDSTGQAE